MTHIDDSDSEKQELVIPLYLTKIEVRELHEYVYAALCYKPDEGNNALNNAYEKLMHLRDVPNDEYKSRQALTSETGNE